MLGLAGAAAITYTRFTMCTCAWSINYLYLLCLDSVNRVGETGETSIIPRAFSWVWVGILEGRIIDLSVLIKER